MRQSFTGILETAGVVRHHTIAPPGPDTSPDWEDGEVTAHPSTAGSRDVRLPDGATVQVKYLANPATGRWVNEHPVRRIPGADWYAVVLIEDFAVTGALMFPCTGLAPIGAALNKRGALALEAGWDLTRPNWVAIRDQAARFRALGMRVLLPPGFTDVA